MIRSLTKRMAYNYPILSLIVCLALTTVAVFLVSVARRILVTRKTATEEATQARDVDLLQPRYREGLAVCRETAQDQGMICGMDQSMRDDLWISQRVERGWRYGWGDNFGKRLVLRDGQALVCMFGMGEAWQAKKKEEMPLAMQFWLAVARRVWKVDEEGLTAGLTLVRSFTSPSFQSIDPSFANKKKSVSPRGVEPLPIANWAVEAMASDHDTVSP
jgi:hypothetical protein